MENLKIRFSPLRSLNDPYESLPLVDLTSHIEDAVERVTVELEELWEKTSIEERTPENLRILEENRQAIIKGVQSTLNEDAVGDDLITLLGEQFGVLSLSRSNLSLLMWAHYAGDSTGYVIGFNEKHDFFLQKDVTGKVVSPFPVRYSDQRIIVDQTKNGWYEKLFCSKPIEWAYEQEERMFMTMMDLHRSIGKDKYGLNILLYEIPKEAISAVYLGVRATNETRDRVLSAVKNNAINCKVYQTTMSRSEYKIEFSELEI